jgi:hypothetical protein
VGASPLRLGGIGRYPFLVIHADRFVEAIRAEIKSERVLALPEHLGAID